MKYFLSNKIRTTLMLLLALLLSSNFLLAQREGDDIKFMAQSDMDNSGGSSGVYLYWFISDDSTPGAVDVWVEEGVINTPEEMQNAEKLITLTSNDWTYEQGTYMYFLQKSFEKGYYSFYISATMADGSVKKSNVSIVDFYDWNNTKYLEFTSIPEQTALKEVEYTYTVIAVDPEDENAVITYSLMANPEGMTIDESSGLINWTPTEKGDYEVWIHAVSQSNPDAAGDQYFYIHVYSCSNPAIISGTITDSKDNPVNNGYVQLVPEDYMRNEKGYYENNFSEVIDGKYSLEADEGKYYMVFQDLYGFYQIYENTYILEEGKLIETKCGDNLTIDMKLLVELSNELFTVKGRVTNEDGTPAIYTSVEFEGVWYEQQDPNGQGRSAFFSAVTDEQGYYEIELPNRFSYTAYVYGYYDPVNGMARALYYNQTYDRKDAEKIVLTADRDDINFVLDANGGYNFFVVSGNVSKKDGTPVEYANVVFQGFFDDGWGGRYPYFWQEALTDAQGNYSIKIPDAYEYTAFVTVPNSMLYKQLFYNQTYNPDEAEIIKLTEDRSGINFVIEEPDFKTYKVSGVVKKEDGTPIEGAYVVFEGYNEDPNIYQNQWSNQTITDSEGKYEMELPEIFKYIAYALDISLFDKYGSRMPLYYNQTYNPEEAASIELTGDRDDINFTFKSNPYGEYNSSISGIVENEDGEKLSEVYLMAYLIGSNGEGSFYDGRTSISDETGEFKFMSMMPGTYYLLAVPMTLDYQPGFYKENSSAVLNWDEATSVEVKEGEALTGIKVVLGKITYGKMEGDLGICQASGRIKAKTNNPYNSEVNVSDAIIYLKDQYGKVNQYTTSNNDGSFNLKNLPNGTFVLQVEKIGYQTYKEDLTFADNQSFNVGDILLTAEAMNVKNTPVNVFKISAYPNPAKDDLAVSFECKQGGAKISLVNTNGKTFLTRTVETVSGSNNLTLDLRGLASGAYYVVIDNGMYSQSYPITIQR